jgi:hypothetical protein
MAKNGPIYPKIGHIMYLWYFYEFPNFCQNRPIFGRFLAKKPCFFRFFGPENKTQISPEKSISSFSFGQIGLNLSKNTI